MSASKEYSNFTGGNNTYTPQNITPAGLPSPASQHNFFDKMSAEQILFFVGISVAFVGLIALISYCGLKGKLDLVEGKDLEAAKPDNETTKLIGNNITRPMPINCNGGALHIKGRLFKTTPIPREHTEKRDFLAEGQKAHSV